jgi:hypothetical protein
MIIITGCALSAAIGYMAHSCIYHMRLRRLEIETWRAAKIFYDRKAYELMTRKQPALSNIQNSTFKIQHHGHSI